MKKTLVFLLFSISLFAKGNYIIMADDLAMLKLFRDDREKVISIAEEIASEYDGLIFHLGSTVIFSKGEIFYYNSSQENLKEFISIINKNNKKVYFWFLDSFGNNDFEKIYLEHLRVVDELSPKLQEFKFDGIVIDLEWINYNKDGVEIDNSKKLMEIIYNIEKVLNKEVFVFGSLINDEKENQKRGYNKKDYEKILPMLYIKDGGFYEGIKGNPVSFYTDSRIDDLKDYYKKNFKRIVVAMEHGIILKRNGDFYFVRNFGKFDKDINNILENLDLLEEFEYKYHTVKKMQSKKDFLLKKNDSSYEEISKNELLYLFETNKKLLSDEDIIWEYFKYIDN